VPLIVAVNNDVPARTLRQFVDMSQAKRGVQGLVHGQQCLQRTSK
jgi:hypothetical protein